MTSNDYERIAKMTNQEAADILRNLLITSNKLIGRANGKSRMHLMIVQALLKGIEALENDSRKNHRVL